MVYCVLAGMNCSCICIVSLRLSGVLCAGRYELQRGVSAVSTQSTDVEREQQPLQSGGGGGAAEGEGEEERRHQHLSAKQRRCALARSQGLLLVYN